MSGTVLVLRALGLGDFLTGVPAYRALRTAFPAHEIVLAAPGALASLTPLTGALDRLLPTAELAPVPWTGPPPDLAVDLHGNGPDTRRLVDATGAAVRWSFGRPAGPAWDEHEHEVARWCRLLAWWGVPADPRALRLAAPPGAGVPSGATVVHPGAASGSRRWPPDRFAAAARALTDAGHRIVVTGGPGEETAAHEVAARAGLGPEAVHTGLDLVRLAALTAGARLVLSGDTGVAHLAFAYARPSVTLYGPVSPALWGPPARPQHRILWHGRGGRPGDAHGTAPDPRLLQITVSEVLAAARAAERLPEAR